MPAAIELIHYSWQYLHTEQPALKNVTLTIDEGAFIGIIGPNGAGKTTLAYSINGLIPAQYNGIKQGEVRVFGVEVEKYHRGQLQKVVGMVFADPEAQFTAMTVEDELVFGMENLGMTIPEIRERLEWVTELVDLGPLLLKPPYEISGGQKQRVALAAVLAMTPKVLILDEPTSMLDPISRKRVFDVLAKLKEEQRNTIIVIEHALENLIPLAEKMFLFSKGELLFQGMPQTLFQQRDLLLQQGIYPPGAIRFFYELIEAGYYQGKIPLSLDDANHELRRLMIQHKQA